MNRVECDGCGEIIEPADEVVEMTLELAAGVQVTRVGEWPWPRHSHRIGACIVRAAGLGGQ